MRQLIVLFSYMLLCLQYAADVTNNSMHAVYKLLCILQVMDRVVVTPDGEQPPPLGGEFEESEEVSFQNVNCGQLK
jgi:hypothetical protein